MPLTDDETALFNGLSSQMGAERAELRRLDAYYEGTQRLEQIGLAVPPALERFVTTVNWPRTVVGAVEERIDLEGFRVRGQDDADPEMWRVWQANDLDEESQLAHLDALVFGRSFVCVGAGEDVDTPLVTVESPEEMTCRVDPRDRSVSAALRRYKDGSDELATLYFPGATVWLERRQGRWVETDRDKHGLGVVPVVPLVNRPRIKRRLGTSQMNDVITLTDAAARALTNAQVATEVLAVPQRYVLGASPQDFVDAEGNPVTAWETYFGAVWALQNDQSKVGQFSAADLKNFETIVNHYAAMVAGVYGLPMRYLGMATVNPPSEGSIVSEEARLTMTCRRKHRAWEGSWERVMRLVRRLQTGEWDPALRSMETLWRDPETPTRAQQADATVKLVQAGVLPVEAAWEDLGYSTTRRQNLRDLRDRERADPTLERIARDLTANAAAAGVG